METSSAATGSSSTIKRRLHRQSAREADALPLAAAEAARQAAAMLSRQADIAQKARDFRGDFAAAQI